MDGGPDEPSSTFGDHFSHAPDAYRAFRPAYPDALFDHLAALCRRRRFALECGAGSGQATGGLARHFRTVLATDASPAHLAAAPASVALRAVCLAEALPVADGSVDLVAVAQALHWFRLDAFFREVRRVAAPGAVLAAWTYGLPEVGPGVDERLRAFAHGEIDRFWPPGRVHVEERYASVPFPFEASDPAMRAPDGPPSFETRLLMSGERFLGYVRTWSAVKRAAAATGADPVEGLERGFDRLWGPLTEERLVRWPITLAAGRVG